MPTGKGCRDKGLAYERELIKYFQDNHDLNCARGTAGAQAFDLAKGSADLFGLPKISVEAKRTEKFKHREFTEQNRRNASPGEIPVIIHRYNRQSIEQSSVLMSLEDFSKLYEAYLTVNGYKK